MTKFEQLAHCDHLEGRLAALHANAAAFIQGRYEPSFAMLPNPDVWSVPHPYEDAPPDEWHRVALAAGVALTIVSAVMSFRFYPG